MFLVNANNYSITIEYFLCQIQTGCFPKFGNASHEIGQLDAEFVN